MHSTTGAGAAYTAYAAGTDAMCSSTGAGAADPTDAGETYSPTGDGAAYPPGAGDVPNDRRRHNVLIHGRMSLRCTP